MRDCYYNHGIYELPHQLPNDLTLKKLGNIMEVPKLHGIIAQRPGPPTNFANASKKTPWKPEIRLFPPCATSHET